IRDFHVTGVQTCALPISEIQVNVLGINHFTWIDRAHYQDVDLLALLDRHLAEPGTLRAYTREEVESWGNWFRSADQVKFALYQRSEERRVGKGCRAWWEG